MDYCEKVWKMKPIEVPKPSSEAHNRVFSAAALHKLENKYKRSMSMDVHASSKKT